MTRREERGAVAAIVAVAMTMLIGVAAFAVDLGTQRVVRADMQALADMVALDAARLLDGRTGGAIEAGDGEHPALSTVVRDSVRRNVCVREADDPCASRRWDVDDTDVSAVLVFTETTEAGSLVPRRHDGSLVEVPDDEVPDAVYVVASGDTDFSFSVGVGRATRSALAAAESNACYQLGSYAASIDPGSSTVFGGLLKPLLGSSTLSAAGYQGLASANVSVLELISAPSIGVGTVDELLALPDLTVGDLFLAAAYALTGQGKVAEAAVLSSAATSVVAPFVLDFNDVLAIDGASEAALGTHLNVLDLLVGTAFLANGENFLDVHNLQAGLSSVGVTTGTELKIIERARRWCTGFSTEGPETSQVTFRSNIKVEPDNKPLLNTDKSRLRLVNVETGTPSATLNLELDVDLAGAHAVLASATCDPDVFAVDVWTNLLRASITASAHVSGEIAGVIDLGILGKVGVEVPVSFGITVGASASRPAASQPTRVELSYPPLTYGEQVPVPADDFVLPDVSITMTEGTLDIANPLIVKAGLVEVPVSLALLRGVVDPVLNSLLSPTGALVTKIEPLVQPVIDKVNDILVQLNKALGMNLSGADVYGLEESTCGSPRLRG